MEVDLSQKILDFVKQPGKRAAASRPQVTLSYAQSIDGSLTWMRGQATAISGSDALQLTHHLRAAHDAILVGIGTVLADDPQLSVRLVEGANPQPLILDSQLRFPLDAKLLREGREPWIFCAHGQEPGNIEALQKAGAKVIPIARSSERGLDLAEFLRELNGLQIGTVMLEGGAGLMTSFLAKGLADKAVITIGPRFIGGLNALTQRLGKTAQDAFPSLVNPKVGVLGDDLIVWGAMNYT